MCRAPSFTASTVHVVKGMSFRTALFYHPDFQSYPPKRFSNFMAVISTRSSNNLATINIGFLMCF